MPELEWTLVSNRLTGELQGQIRGYCYNAVKEICDAILTDVRRRLDEPKHGRVYVKGGLSHQASAPGEAPASDTGALWAGWEVGVSMTADGPVGIIDNTEPYAAALEYGDGHIAPRPSLTTAMHAASQSLAGAVQRALAALGRAA